jgi:hypothetical protein
VEEKERGKEKEGKKEKREEKEGEKKERERERKRRGNRIRFVKGRDGWRGAQFSRFRSIKHSRELCSNSEQSEAPRHNVL